MVVFYVGQGFHSASKIYLISHAYDFWGFLCPNY